MKKTVKEENEKLLYSYHIQLINAYDTKRNCPLSKMEFRGDTVVTDIESPTIYDYVDFPSGFGDILFEQEIDDSVKSKALLAIGANDSAHDEERVDFGHLLIALSRTLPLVDMVVKRICDMNIGVGVTGEDNAIHSMREALIWLNVKSNDSRELAFRDVESLKRFLKYQVIRMKSMTGKPSTPYNIAKAYREVIEHLDRLGEKNKIFLLRKYKYELVAPFIEDMFSVFELLYAYYGYMRLSDKKLFESQNAGHDWAQDYKKIYNLAITVQNGIFRRFVSSAKIGDLNIPHGAYVYSDFMSTTMSDSNLINSDFNFTDFSDSVFKDCDISASDLSFCKANGSDFSRSNLNACNLSGSDFSNATLNEVQMLNVLFRDPSLDYISRDNEVLMKKRLDKTRRFAETREDVTSRLGRSSGSIALELGNSFFYNLGKKGRAEGLDEWKYTTVGEDKTIKVHLAMDDACKLYREKTKGTFERLNSEVITTDALDELQGFFNSETLPEQRARETELYFIPVSSKFEDTTMIRALLPHADLSHVCMRSATINEADINDARCYYTDFTNAAMIGTNFSGAQFYRASLGGANLSKANLINSALIDCSLKGASFNRALLLNAAIVNNNIDAPYISRMLTDSDVSPVETLRDEEIVIGLDMSLNDCNFNNVVGSGIIVSGMNADQSTWIEAEIRRAIFFNTIARWTQFDRADMSYSLLIGVSFHQASLSEAQFSNTRFYACDMSGVRLHRANLISARLDKVVFQNADMSRSNLSRTVFKNCAFSDVNFSEVNVSDAVFENVIFENVKFSSCIGLATAKFKHCFFADNCYKLDFQSGADGKQDKSFMSIPHSTGRIKFFKDEVQDYSAFGEHQYTSLSWYLSDDNNESDEAADTNNT